MAVSLKTNKFIYAGIICLLLITKSRRNSTSMHYKLKNEWIHICWYKLFASIYFSSYHYYTYMWTGGYVSAGTASDGNGSLTIRQPPDSWWISWLTVLIPLAGDHKLGGWRLETRWLADINQPPGQCEPATWREWNSQRAKVNPVVESKLAEDIYGIPVLHVLSNHMSYLALWFSYLKR